MPLIKKKNEEDQLIFLCSLYRKVKEDVSANIEKSINDLENYVEERVGSEVLQPKVYANKKPKTEKAFMKKLI